jgi:hypothetical protein
MVKQSDFTVRLVEANSKQPFKEHYHNGKVYVGVKSDLEYYISIKKTGTSIQSPAVLQIVVDEKEMNYVLQYPWPVPLYPPGLYVGVRYRSRDVVTMKALKFEKPRVVSDGTTSISGSLTGTIKIHVHQGIFEGMKKKRHTHSNKQGNKSLRSTEGGVSYSKQCRGKPCMHYRKGDLIDTITLNYCATEGLVEAGVLPKPSSNVFDRNRMVLKFVNGCRAEVRQIEQDQVPQIINLCGTDDNGGGNTVMTTPLKRPVEQGPGFNNLYDTDDQGKTNAVMATHPWGIGR